MIVFIKSKPLMPNYECLYIDANFSNIENTRKKDLFWPQTSLSVHNSKLNFKNKFLKFCIQLYNFEKMNLWS